jgi:signal transduction histidine kinase
VGEVFGLDNLQSTRFITAVSEIARNAVQFAGGGSVAFRFDEGTAAQLTQYLVAVISDSGPGIGNIAAALEGRTNSKGQRPLGLVGSRRLVDMLNIECPKSGGTVVTLKMLLPRSARRLQAADIGTLVEQLARKKAATPLEELEKQNREMLETLQQLRLRQVQLEKADAQKNQFVAMLAHELRSPLGTLHMVLKIIQRNVHMKPDELTRLRDIMGRQTDHLTKLVNDLMDVSRVSQGKVDMDKSPVEVNELVTQAIEMTDAAVSSKHHQVQLKLYHEDLWIEGDVIRLKQVLCNLLNNAARYTPEEGLISVCIVKQGNFVEITVADNGIGISEELLPHMFDLFVQGDTSLSKTQAGLGIGLTLVKSLVERHGGTVAAHSEGCGFGSQFVVCLPLS